MGKSCFVIQNKLIIYKKRKDLYCNVKSEKICIAMNEYLSSKTKGTISMKPERV